jgi:hypothetical protein
LAIHIAWSRGERDWFEHASESKADLIDWFHQFKSRMGSERVCAATTRKGGDSDGTPVIRPRRRRSAA